MAADAMTATKPGMSCGLKTMGPVLRRSATTAAEYAVAWSSAYDTYAASAATPCYN